jgi:streptomycin 6-kinase
MRLSLPPRFTRMVVSVHGARGARWLDGLADLLAACADRWELTVGPPYPISYSYVAPAVRADGSHAVLKLAVPSDDLRRSVAALELIAGDGAARLLASDLDAGAVLLERVEPGTRLTGLVAGADEAATGIVVDVMRRLHRPVADPSPFPTVADWSRGFAELRERHGGGTGSLPAARVAAAERRYAELDASAAPPVLLHGDLHHENVLRSDRAGWLAIDVAGVLGEPAFDVGALLHNPWPGLLDMPDPRRLLARRIDLLADGLGVDRDRVSGWGFAFSVLSAIWCDEDEAGGPVDPFILRCVEILGDLDGAAA